MKKLAIATLLTLTSTLCFSGQWIAVDGGVIEIDLQENELENKLWAYATENYSRKFEPKEKYTFQYKAVSETEILINAVCDTHGTTNLTKDFIMVFDGGSCYFQATYNFKAGAFVKLEVNGEA